MLFDARIYSRRYIYFDDWTAEEVEESLGVGCRDLMAKWFPEVDFDRFLKTVMNKLSSRKEAMVFLWELVDGDMDDLLVITRMYREKIEKEKREYEAHKLWREERWKESGEWGEKGRMEEK